MIQTTTTMKRKLVFGNTIAINNNSKPQLNEVVVDNRLSSYVTIKMISNNNSQQLVNNNRFSQTPNNSCSRIILNCSTNFNSLRIEDPKRANDESNDIHVKLMVNSIPTISRHFIINGKLGEGTFSKVYRARSVRDSAKEYALKYIIPTIKPSRVATELRYLRDLGGTDNIIPLKTCLFSNGHTVIVMPIFSHQKFNDYVHLMSVDEVRHYMQNLLIALQKVHSHRIIHRDIKPANFLYNRATRRYALVDFGLAQHEKELIRLAKSVVPNECRNNETKPAVKALAKNTVVTDNKYNQVNAAKRCVLTELASNKASFQNEIKWQIRKRSRTEVLANELKVKTVNKAKKSRNECSKTTLIPSVFNSPLTPDCIKTPDCKKMLFKNENLMTPRKAQLSVIPETPPKTVQKSNNGLNTDVTQTTTIIPVVINETPKKSDKKEAKSKPKKSDDAAKKRSKQLKCQCLGTDHVCSVCKSKSELIAPRAGTPGFRAPEVLLKYVQQTTLIDVWSAGVIFACLLTGRYPFFRNIDDMTALAEICTVLGSKRVKRAAIHLGKTITMSANCTPMSLKSLCQQLRGTKSEFKPHDSAYDLLDKLLEPNPNKRLSAATALNHPYFNS